MKEKLWKFTDNLGSFGSSNANEIKTLYFPLANEVLMSSVSPDLRGDIKTSQNSFLLTPASRDDLINSRYSRNFWVYISKDKVWSASGVSKSLRQIQEDKFKLEAGLLWHKISRENKKIGLKAEILSFTPSSGEPVEIMQVKLTNITKKDIKFIPCAAIPIYARGANNLRDHRHVTSLLQRIRLHKYGVIVKPTLVFDESGHSPNKALYFVLGQDEFAKPPEYLYPTQEMFCGEGGDLEAPESVLKNSLPDKYAQIQGKEAIGALRFRSITLKPDSSKTYIVLMGITEDERQIKSISNKFNSLDKVKKSFEGTKYFWANQSKKINLSTGDTDFDNWFRWVSVQPLLRRIFGCSFLPDFDYGKGGRGWRDLWQDSLSLILNNPQSVRSSIINNFAGVRIDGSNATIIGKKQGEFISDRNNISRVWMDHGVWPLITLDLYINETADFDILFEKTAYFRGHQLLRSAAIDTKWNTGKIYKGSVLEHLLIQNLVQFFNVGRHNHVRLEGGDWNDGLDMAWENGESVAFSCMYAHNLSLLSELILKTGVKKIEIASELRILLSKVKYDNVRQKLDLLQRYFAKITEKWLSGSKIKIDSAQLAGDLKIKSIWMKQHINKTEWLRQGFFNGYYDNKSKRVEGRKDGRVKMMLASQVFPIMSGAADEQQVKKAFASIEKYLFDKRVRGFHLNTDFGRQEHELGRAFSFVYGDKENGAFFNHMTVMLAFALYSRGFVKQGWRVFNSIYNMAIDSSISRIYPCLPEYFNAEGRGMYSYLTGSASWFVLTLLSQVFGVRGKDGDLLIEPKLALSQFKNSPILQIRRSFQGRSLVINFHNPRKLDYPGYKITRVRLNSHALKSSLPRPSILIDRKLILKLPSHKPNQIDIYLG